MMVRVDKMFDEMRASLRSVKFGNEGVVGGLTSNSSVHEDRKEKMNRNDLMLSIDQDESDSVIGWIPYSSNQEIIFSEDFNFNAVEDEREGNSEYIESSSMLELVNLNQTEATEEHHEDSDEVPCEMVTGDASNSVASSFISTNLKSVIISDRFDFVGVASKGKLVRPIVWKVTEVCGKLERVVSMVYVLGNKLITVSDHYRFRLLVMGWSSNCVDFWIMGRSKGVVATTPLGSPFGNGNGVQSQLLLLDAAGLSIKQPVIILEMKILGIFSLRVGKLADNKISWGGNSGFRDGSELKLDVSKGMHYALDYKQIGFPLTFTVIVLPFPILEYGDRIEEVNQLETTQEFVPKAVKIAAAMVSTFLMFQAASVNVHYVEDESVPTGICVVCVVGGEWLLFANLLATNCYKSERLKRPDNLAFVENATYFYIAGIFLMVSLDYMQLVVEQAIGINNVFSLNLFVPFSCEFFKDALEEVLPNMDFILGNETEASIFSKVHGRVTNDVANESSKIWNLLKGSATTLDVLSIVFGEEILPTLILVIQAKLSTRADKTWNERVAIIWAIVAIGESCITGFSPQMSKIADNGHQKGYEQIDATLMGLLQRILNTNKWVQGAACSIIAMLEEEYCRRKIRMPLLLTTLLKVSKSVKDFPPLLECVTSIAHALVEIPYDKKLIACSLELFLGLAKCLGSETESLALKNNLKDLLLQCCKVDTRQSAIASLGNLARVCPIHIHACLSGILVVIAKQLNTPNFRGTILIAHNVCWVSGDLAINGCQKISLNLITVTLRLVRILQQGKDQNEDQRNAIECSPLALSSLTMPHMQPFWIHDLHYYNWAPQAVHHCFAIGGEIISDLRSDMTRLQQGMNNIQRMLKASIGIQLELQLSIQQEVYTVLNPSVSSQGIGDNWWSKDALNWGDYTMLKTQFPEIDPWGQGSTEEGSNVMNLAVKEPHMELSHEPVA